VYNAGGGVEGESGEMGLGVDGSIGMSIGVILTVRLRCVGNGTEVPSKSRSVAVAE